MDDVWEAIGLRISIQWLRNACIKRLFASLPMDWRCVHSRRLEFLAACAEARWKRICSVQKKLSSERVVNCASQEAKLDCLLRAPAFTSLRRIGAFHSCWTPQLVPLAFDWLVVAIDRESMVRIPPSRGRSWRASFLTREPTIRECAQIAHCSHDDRGASPASRPTPPFNIWKLGSGERARQSCNRDSLWDTSHCESFCAHSISSWDISWIFSLLLLVRFRGAAAWVALLFPHNVTRLHSICMVRVRRTRQHSEPSVWANKCRECWRARLAKCSSSLESWFEHKLTLPKVTLRLGRAWAPTQRGESAQRDHDERAMFDTLARGAPIEHHRRAKLWLIFRAQHGRLSLTSELECGAMWAPVSVTQWLKLAHLRACSGVGKQRASYATRR